MVGFSLVQEVLEYIEWGIIGYGKWGDYRLNKAPCHTEPLSVVGSQRYGGRCNLKGLGILYTSRTPELSLLDLQVHLPCSPWPKPSPS